MKKTLRRIWFKIFKSYRRIEVVFVTYADGDKLIKANDGKPESEQWHIAKEEDNNRLYGMVYLERRERITV